MNDQEERKRRSEEYIISLDMEINPALPCVDSEENVRLRTAKEVSERIVALAYTNLLAFDSVTSDWLESRIEEYRIEHLFTENEKNFIADPSPERKIHESWKVEAIWTLLWSLEIVETLDFPDHLVDLNDLGAGMYPIGKDCDPNEFIERHKTLRSAAEILDADDLYYRYYWACVERRIHGKSMDIVNPEIVYERLYALNWLIHYCDQDWDDISTDT